LRQFFQKLKLMQKCCVNKNFHEDFCKNENFCENFCKYFCFRIFAKIYFRFSRKNHTKITKMFVNIFAKMKIEAKIFA
jgi:hypothetical protein